VPRNYVILVGVDDLLLVYSKDSEPYPSYPE
jgi:hypothetical protein